MSGHYRAITHHFDSKGICCDVVEGEITGVSLPRKTRLLYRTASHPTHQQALLEAVPKFFALYELKHGFKHPSDPTRTSLHGEPDALVLHAESAHAY